MTSFAITMLVACLVPYARHRSADPLPPVEAAVLAVVNDDVDAGRRRLLRALQGELAEGGALGARLPPMPGFRRFSVQVDSNVHSRERCVGSLAEDMTEAVAAVPGWALCPAGGCFDDADGPIQPDYELTLRVRSDGRFAVMVSDLRACLEVTVMETTTRLRVEDLCTNVAGGVG